MSQLVEAMEDYSDLIKRVEIALRQSYSDIDPREMTPVVEEDRELIKKLYEEFLKKNDHITADRLAKREFLCKIFHDRLITPIVKWMHGKSKELEKANRNVTLEKGWPSVLLDNVAGELYSNFSYILNSRK